MAQNFFSYIFKNPVGSNTIGTGNLLPAAFTTFSNLLSLQGNKSQYELYKEQAREYVKAARDQAALIEKEGAIALRNMQYKNAQLRGQEKLAVAAKGGQMSGSNLDVLVRQEKIRLMDETTLKANYVNQAMLELNKGYQAAAGAYGTMATKASADKASVWASLLKGAEVYVASTVRDIKELKAVENQWAMLEYQRDTTKLFYDEQYKLPDDKLKIAPSEEFTSMLQERSDAGEGKISFV